MRPNIESWRFVSYESPFTYFDAWAFDSLPLTSRCWVPVPQTIWLRTNYRVYWASAVVAVLAVACCLSAAITAPSQPTMIASWVLVAVGVAAVVVTMRRARQSRLAYEPGFLIVSLGGRTTARIPIDVVECFFRGQGPSLLPVPSESLETESSTVIVRLAEAAKEWHHGEIPVSLGHWCEGYITIRGTWCEPITAELIGSLNRNLVQAHRDLRTQKAVSP